MDNVMLSTLIISLIVIAFIIYVVFKLFEKSKPSVEYIVLLAMLSAIAIVGRLLGIPFQGVQAASFVIIMSGFIFGKETGFLVGVVTALVSGLFISLGYWVFYQMLAWGLMGFTSGIFVNRLTNPIVRGVWGLAWGLIYGWITNIVMFFYMGVAITFDSVIAMYAASFYVDLLHGVSNAVLLIVAYDWFKNILLRAKKTFYSNNNESLKTDKSKEIKQP